MNRSAHPTGKQLLGAAWRSLRQDSELLWLPFFGGLAAVVAAVILFLPGYALGWLIAGQQDHQVASWVGLAFALFASTVVAVFFQAALVIGANERASGGDPTRSSALAGAWRRRKQILGWAVLSTTVGLLLRIVQDRIGGLGGALLGSLGGLAWGVASFLVVPVLVAEDVGPFTAVKRSSQVLRDTWGTSLRTTLRFGVIALVVWLPVIAIGALGVYLLAGDGGDTTQIAGAVLLGLALIALIIVGTVFSAITSYAKALIYRYASNEPTPGVDGALFAGAFTPKSR